MCVKKNESEIKLTLKEAGYSPVQIEKCFNRLEKYSLCVKKQYYSTNYNQGNAHNTVHLYTCSARNALCNAAQFEEREARKNYSNEYNHLYWSM